MNKAQLVEALATARFEGNKRQAQHALESVLDTITRTVAKGEKVAITGFGAFEKIDRPARMVRNPRTGERKRARKTSVPKFRAGAELKGVVSGAKKLPRLPKATTPTTPTTRTAKATAKKATAKSASAPRATTRATAKKATAKKATAKRATATTRKVTAKRATAKRTARR